MSEQEGDAAILAMLPHVATHGWSEASLRRGLADLGVAGEAAAWLYAGPAEMIEAYVGLADRRMAAEAAGLTESRVSRRIRAIVALRLRQARGERVAVRHAMARLAWPGHAVSAARSLARTVDAMWHAAGDRAVDFNWYTKRATLAAVYGATLLFWLRQDEWSDPEDALTLAFLDRRLAGVGRMGRLRRRFAGGV